MIFLPSETLSATRETIASLFTGAVGASETESCDGVLIHAAAANTGTVKISRTDDATNEYLLEADADINLPSKDLSLLSIRGSDAFQVVNLIVY